MPSYSAAVLLLVLALLGEALAIHFTLAYYGRITSKAVPAALCRRDEQNCITILQTPYARMFGVPNSLLGIVFYLVTGAVAGLALAGALPGWLRLAALAASALTVLLAPYLVWALLDRLKTWCGL